ncbi:MAG: DUF1028 domain-containing protein [Acidimicrobiales bacterium]
MGTIDRCRDRDGLNAGRPVCTYSIVARDPLNGQLGAAVQSHYFSVGSVVPWVEAGVGAIVTQAMIEISYGPLGLDLMRAGVSPGGVLEKLVRADDGAALRQVAMVDTHGLVAAHTGEWAIREAAHRTGDGYSVQANMMLNPHVVDAMAHAFEAAEGELSLRMMEALDAAEAQGGDIRGKQSAALMVADNMGDKPSWRGTRYDLRVEDHPEPLAELRRLLTLARAYRAADEGDVHSRNGAVDAVEASYQQAHELAPDNAEIMFWHAVRLVGVGRVDDAVPLFRDVFMRSGQWRQLLARLPESRLMAIDDATLKRLTEL